jgi:hypothetical protein
LLRISCGIVAETLQRDEILNGKIIPAATTPQQRRKPASGNPQSYRRLIRRMYMEITPVICCFQQGEGFPFLLPCKNGKHETRRRNDQRPEVKQVDGF